MVDTTYEVAQARHTSLAHRVAHANRRVVVGAVALIFTIFSLFSPMASQRAHAQTGAEAAAAAVAAAETADALCKAVYGAENIADCVDKVEDAVGDDKDKIEDFGKCVSGELKNPAEDEGESDSSAGGDAESGNGGDSNSNSEEQGKDGALKKCLDDMDKDEEEKEDTPEAINNLSLYRMGSALTAFYTNNLIPGGPEDSSSSDNDDKDSDSGDSDSDTKGTTGLKAWKKLLSSPAMAGGFLAAPNDDFQESQKWMFGAGGGVNDATLSYSSVDRSHDSDASDAGISKYGYFGAMLAGLGLDSTSSSGTVGGAISSTGGVAMLAAYTLAGAVDTIFDTFLELLQTLNPFRLLTDALTKDSGSSFASGMPSAAEGEHGMFDDLREFLGDMYTGFVQLGWLVTVPVLIGFTVMAILLSRRFNASDGIKKLAIRIAFIGVGIPLLGSTYTGALESMQGASGDSAKANATKVVMSTYVDFEGWTDARLQLPTNEAKAMGDSSGRGFGWNYDTNSPTDDAQARVRTTASAINAMVAGIQGDDDVAKILNPKMQSRPSQDQNAKFNSLAVEDGKALNNSGDATAAYKYTADLLNRYIHNDRVASSDYEGRVKGAVQKWAGEDKEKQKVARGWVQDFTDANSLQGMDDKAVADLNNPLIQVDDKSGLTGEGEDGQILFNNGSGGVKHGTDQCKPSDIGQGGEDGKVDLPSCNLSTLAMYNYLNTDFGPTSMRMYSPDKSTSTFQRVEHNSVTPVGSGLMQYIYWFSAMTLLISFAIIGIIYGITLVFSSIRRGIQLIMAIPFGLMGFIAGAAKAVIYTIAMFLEIFLTLFAYKVIQEFMMAIPALIETPLVEHLSSEESKTIGAGIGLGALAAATSNPATVVLIVTLLSTIGIIIFTMLAIKLRGSIVSAMEEAVTQAINKVVGTGVSSGREPGQSGIKQGLARGAGLGATHAVMSDGKSGGGDGAADSVADAADSGDATGAGAVAGGAAGAAAGLGGTAMAGDMSGDGEAGMTDASVDAEGSDAEFSNAAFSDGGGTVEGIDGDIDGDVDGGYLDAGQDYDVDANGGMVDADGNPVMVGEGDDARQVGLNDLGDFDSQGQLVGDDGNPVIGEDGNPVTASDIHGVNSDGYFTDVDGAPIMTADGSPIKADGVGGTAVGEGQAAESMTVGESAGSDEAVAEQVANEGGLQFASADSSATPTFATGGAEGAEAQSGMDKAMGTVDEVANKAADSEALSGTGAGAVAGAVAGRGTGRSLADNMHTLSDNLNQNVDKARAAQAGHTPVENISNALHGQTGVTGAAPVSGEGSQDNVRPASYRQVSDLAPLSGSARGAQPVDGSDSARMVAAGMAGSLATRGANKVMNPRSRTMSESVTGGRSQSGGQSGGSPQSPRGGRRRGGRTGSVAGQAAQSAALSQGVRRGGNRQGSGRHSQHGHGGHDQQGHGHSPQSNGRHHRGDEGGTIST